MHIFFDVETIPSQHPEARTWARETVKPPGSYKKPESIAKWWEEEGEAAADEAYRRQALDAAAGELVAISWATEDGEPETVARGPGESEADMLRAFFDRVAAILQRESVTGADGRPCWDADPFFIAHNAPFDLGYLWRRSIILGVRPPFRLPSPGARDGKDYGDTMTLWAGYRQTIGLSRLCRALGVPDPKTEGDGGQVFDWWQAGDLERIARYNRADVAAVRACWWRLHWGTAA